MKRPVPFVASLILVSACASTPTVDMQEPRRVVGTENNVRVDAEIFGERLTGTSTVPIKYVVTNERPTPIAIAELIPESTYDEETRVVTINFGSEVPGTELLPHLITIAPGEKKSFSTSVRVHVPFPKTVNAVQRTFPRAMRIKVNFLGGDLAEFSPLLTMTEKALADRDLADALFPKWVEMNEAVYTNAIPMRWGGMQEPVRGSAASRFLIRAQSGI